LALRLLLSSLVLTRCSVFLDEHDNIKLGDFGLSKALLEQASFASTYVGTPYYMSPELMQEKVCATLSSSFHAA
jgi:serine/threonine protein kinase